MLNESAERGLRSMSARTVNDNDANNDTSDTSDMNTNTAAPKRVLIVSETSMAQTNGVSGSIRHILRRFTERDIDAYLITPQPAPDDGTVEGFLVDTVPSWPIQRFYVAIPRKTSVIRSITELTESGWRPDIIHVAAPISKLGHAALIAGHRLHIPTVAIYQTDVAQYARRFARQAVGTITDGLADGIDDAEISLLGDSLRKPRHAKWLRRISRAAGEQAEQIVAQRIAQMHNKATLTLAPTEQARQRLEEFGVDPKLIQLWGRGVDSTLFTPTRRDGEHARQLHETWSHGGTLPVVGYVGRLAPEKQVERLAVLDGLGMQLVVVGGGPSEDALHELLPHAIFTGMLHGDALADAYAALDLFVHTGAEETFGQTIQEAMASGLSVVAPASGGPLDLVDDGRTGLLFDPSDDETLYECVARLLADESLRRAMGEAGLSAVQGRTWPALVDQLIDHYYRLVMRH